MSAGIARTVKPMSAGLTTEIWQHQALTVFVFGASGDLAKKKTFPSLFDLFLAGFLPQSTVICGYARSPKSDEEFRSHLMPFLAKRNADEALLAEFLQVVLAEARTALPQVWPHNSPSRAASFRRPDTGHSAFTATASTPTTPR